MNKKNAFTTIMLSISLMFFSSCVNSQPESIDIKTDSPQENVENQSAPTAITLPANVPALIDLLQQKDIGDQNRIAILRRLGQFGTDAKEAVPILAMSLYDISRPYEVREAAAWALGEIGPSSKPAIPVLIVTLQSDFTHVRRASAEALGKIVDTSSIFALVLALSDEDDSVSIAAAESIGLLAGQTFPDMHTNSYHVDENGDLIIVSTAKEWWVREGQFHDWLTQ